LVIILILDLIELSSTHLILIKLKKARNEFTKHHFLLFNLHIQFGFLY